MVMEGHLEMHYYLQAANMQIFNIKNRGRDKTKENNYQLPIEQQDDNNNIENI